MASGENSTERQKNGGQLFQLTQEEKNILKPPKVEERPNETVDKQEELKQKKVMAKPEESEASCLQKFVDIIKNLLFGSKAMSSNYLIKKEMREILENFSPYFYDSRIEKVKESFPAYIYEIYLFLKDIVSLFEEVHKPVEDLDFGKDIFFMNFVDTLLFEDVRNFMSSINHDYFSEIMANSENPVQLLESKLQELQTVIETQNQEAIKQYTLFFEKLLVLASFDFVRFFRVFDPQFSDDPKYNPKFQPVFQATGIIDMKNLNGFFRLLDIEMIPENILIHFDNTIKSMKAKLEESVPHSSEEENVDKAPELESERISRLSLSDAALFYKLKQHNSKRISQFFNKVQALNKKEILEALVRMVSKNYYYKPQLPAKRWGFLFSQYLKMTLARKYYKFNKASEAIKANLVQKRILEFFNASDEAQLLKVHNYDDEITNLLEQRGVRGFSYTHILPLFKTFYERMYKVEIRKCINILLVEGDFLNKKEQEFFSEAYYNLDKSMDKFIILDSEMDEGEKDMGQIVRFARGDISDARFQVVIQRKVSELESQIRKILKECLGHYGTIFGELKSTNIDLSNPKPKFVANIKSIGGMVGPKKFAKQLKDAEIHLGRFLDLVNSCPGLDLG